MGIRKIRYQFFLLAAVVAFILVVVSSVGFYSSWMGLHESIINELNSTAGEQALRLDAWAQQKAAPLVGAAAMMNHMPTVDEARIQGILLSHEHDADIKDLTYADETGLALTKAGRREAGYDPRTRPWYQDAKQAGHMMFTKIYKDSRTGEPLLSTVVPFNWPNGTFRGVMSDDVSIQALDKVVDQLKYHGVGEGLVIEDNGTIIASSIDGLRFQNATDDDTLQPYFHEMETQKKGYFEAPTSRGQVYIAYESVPTTGWIVAIVVPKTVLYAPLTKLSITCVVLIILGLLLILFFFSRLSRNITGRISSLVTMANVMAKGDLHTESPVDPSPDELGELSRAFHQTNGHLRNLVQQIIKASGHIASSAEELTATTQQLAEVSTSSAQSVSEVANGVTKQTHDMNRAGNEAMAISQDIEHFSQTSANITGNSEQARESAKQGSTLMANALKSMNDIHEAHQRTSTVVTRLGKSQGQIGQIVDTISAIASQTNLLALNAAIEAARAGEQGRGFAVVADEVRKLAGESSKSAEEIRDRITQIQNDTQEAIQAMQTGTDSVTQGMEAIRNVDAQFTGILQKIEGIHGEIETANHNAQTITSAMKRMVDSIEGVGRVAQETSGHAQSISAATEEQNASTEEIAEAAKELAHMAEDLQEATNRFKV